MRNEQRFAFYLEGWEEGDDPAVLKEKAIRISPEGYDENMYGKIFCPECFKRLTRCPRKQKSFDNGDPAYFAHFPRKNEYCPWRSQAIERKVYDSEKSARQAIASGRLVVVHGFQKTKPARSESSGSVSSHVIDANGPEKKLALAKRKGVTYTLPSQITTVQAICTGFNVNLDRYYVLPGSNEAVRLRDVLVDVRDVSQYDPMQKLYYGVVDGFVSFGSEIKPHHTRVVRLRYSKNDKFLHFSLKDKDQNLREKSIVDGLSNRIVLIWGRVGENGAGLCIENVYWGEYSLLPMEYTKLLYPD